MGPRRDYSSLEVVWPARRDTVGDFATALHLRGNTISSLDASLPHHVTQITPLQSATSIPVYLTRLEPCADSRCVIRSVLASFIIEIGET